MPDQFYFPPVKRIAMTNPTYRKPITRSMQTAQVAHLSCPLPNLTGMNSHYRFAALQDAPPVASYPNFWTRRNYNRIYLKMGFDPLDCSHIPMFFWKKDTEWIFGHGSTSFNDHQCLGANTITNLMIIGDHWWSSVIIRVLIVFGDHQWSLKFENIPWTAFRS